METVKKIFAHRIGLFVFCAIWLIVLTVPSLYSNWRHNLLTIDAYNYKTPHYAQPLGYLDYLAGKLPFPRAAGQNPDDPRVQVYSLQMQGKDIRSEFAPIIRKFPNQAWIVGLRLRYGVLGRYYRRTFAGLDPSAPKSANRRKEKGYATPAQIESDIAMAKLGRRLEPDNAFFDWMLAQSYLEANRDAEALAALSEGAKKPRYSDYARDEMLGRIAIRQKEQAIPLTIEQKISISAATFFPHYQPHRNAARFAVAKAAAMERAGDHRGALQLYGDIARIGSVMRNNSYTYIGSMVGQAIQAIAWSRMIKRPLDAKRVRTAAVMQERRLNIARSFATYAKLHGQPALGDEAIRETLAAEQMRKQFTAVFSAGINGKVYSVPTTTFAKLTYVSWLQVALLVQIIGGAFAWITLTAFTRNRRSNGTPVRAVDVACNVLVCWTIIGALAFVVYLSGATQSDMLRAWDFGEGTEQRNASGAAIIEVMGSLIAYMPLAQALVFAVVSLLWQQRRELLRRRTRQANSSPSTVLENAGESWWKRHIWPLVILAIRTVLTVIMTLTWVLWISGGELLLLPIPLLLTVACLLPWLLSKPWQRQPVLFLSIYRATDWFRQSVGASLLVASILYLALSIYIVPIQHHASASVDDYLSKGETALVRARMSR